MAGKAAEQRNVPHAWQRHAWLWDATFYGLLVLTSAWAIRDQAWRSALPALVWALWYLVCLGGRMWRAAAVTRRLLYLTGACAIWYVLTGQHSVFYLLLSALYLQIYALLPLRLSIAVSAGLSLLVLVRGYDPAMTERTWASALAFLISVSMGSLLAWWIDGIIHQSEERQRLIEELAATRRQLAASERQAGILAERQRLAREIHDTLAQGFTSIVMQLEAAEQALPDDPATVQQHLDQARRTARDSLAEARRLVWALRPEALEHGGLPQALQRVTQQWASASDIAASFTLEGTACALHPEVAITLLRALQEALNNVRKHAHAHQVNVLLSYLDDLVLLEVQDDGIGCAAPSDSRVEPAGGGFGLRAMRERVALLGGRVSVEPAPGGGCVLSVALPALAPYAQPAAEEDCDGSHSDPDR